MLFLTYISKLSGLIKCSCFCAVDYNLYGIPDNSSALQEDLITFSNWSGRWLIPRNFDTCIVLHISKFNPRHKFALSSHPLDSVGSQNDSVVTVTPPGLGLRVFYSSLTEPKRFYKYLLYCAYPGFSLRIWIPLYTAYIRAILEFGGPVWYPDL